MTIKEFYKINPLRFIVLLLINIGLYALPILGTVLSIIETTAIQQGNFKIFLIVNVCAFVCLMADYLLQGLSQYILSQQEEQYNVAIRDKTTKHFYADQRDHAVAQVQNRLTNDIVQSQQNYITPFLA